MTNSVKAAADYIKNADALLVTAGAGMGVDSGLPDFRGNDGFWKAYPPYKKLNLNFSGIANPTTFHTNPRMAWGFYGHRHNLYKNTTPHDGFHILRKWANNKNNNYFVFTSNVDGHFQKCGFDNDRVVECHGTINKIQCPNKCFSPKEFSHNYNVNLNDMLCSEDTIPYCKKCTKVARPNILMFGDWEWDGHEASSKQLDLNRWLKSNEDSKIAIVEIGAGKDISTVRRFGENVSSMYDNSKLIRINPVDSDVPRNNISLKLKGLEGLKAIDDALND